MPTEYKKATLGSSKPTKSAPVSGVDPSALSSPQAISKGSLGTRRRTPPRHLAPLDHDRTLIVRGTAIPTSEISNIPTYSMPVAPIEMGVDEGLYKNLGIAAADVEALIFVRKTSKGSVKPFSNKNAVGKKLPTKGKSSNAYFSSGNIPFLSLMAKAIKNWEKEQDDLISITADVKAMGASKTENKYRGEKKYSFIPKLVSLDIFNGKSDKKLEEEGITRRVDADGLIITIKNDNIAGKKNVQAVYKLKKVKFSKVKKIASVRGDSHSLEIKQPEFIKTEDEFCYEVYIYKKTVLDNIPIEAPEKSPPSDTSDTKEPLTKENEWNRYWNGNVKMPSVEVGKEPKETTRKEYKTQFVGEDEWIPLKVLALLTKGSEASNTKRYYEVVADYDVFMIAPKVTHFIKPIPKHSELMQTFNDEVAKTIDEAYFKDVLNPIEEKFLPSSDDGVQRAGISAKARHGIFSSFEISTRKSINRHLGINAVQHGTEVANLYYISDIKEPVMMIGPNYSNINRELFFADLKMLFYLCLGGFPTERVVKDFEPGKLDKYNKRDPEYKVKVNIPNTYSYWTDYAFLFNLTWGAPYYTSVTKPGDEEATAYNIADKKYFSEIYNDFYAKVCSEPRRISSFRKIFGRINEDYFGPNMLFLVAFFQHTKTWKSSPINEQDFISRLLFVKRLVFWGYYYKRVHDAAPKFAPLVFKTKTDSDEVQKIYRYALDGISKMATHLIEKYSARNPGPLPPTASDINKEMKYIQTLHTLVKFLKAKP